MMERVHIVIAEVGEYSARADWVAGVYLDRPEAERQLSEHAVRAQQAYHDMWSWWREFHRLVQEKTGSKYTPTPIPEGIESQVRAHLGPEPGRPEAERFYLVSAPVGTWGAWGWCGDHEDDVCNAPEPEYATPCNTLDEQER